MKPSIPKPCAENYEHMTPSDLGKLCSKCNTEAVDFTSWDTKDIIQYIQSSKTKVCGKLSKTAINAKYSWSTFAKVAASVLLLHSWDNVKADTRSLELTTITSIQNMQSAKDSVILQFVDHENRPLPYVNLINSTTNQKFITNSTGQIKLSNSHGLIFKVLLLGFETKNIKINKKHYGKTLKITLYEVDEWIGEVVVIDNRKTFNNRIKKWLNILSIRDNE